MFSSSCSDFGYTFQGAAEPPGSDMAYPVDYRMHDATAGSRVLRRYVLYSKSVRIFERL